MLSVVQSSTPCKLSDHIYGAPFISLFVLLFACVYARRSSTTTVEPWWPPFLSSHTPTRTSSLMSSRTCATRCSNRGITSSGRAAWESKCTSSRKGSLTSSPRTERSPPVFRMDPILEVVPCTMFQIPRTWPTILIQYDIVLTSDNTDFMTNSSGQATNALVSLSTKQCKLVPAVASGLGVRHCNATQSHPG